MLSDLEKNYSVISRGYTYFMFESKPIIILLQFNKILFYHSFSFFLVDNNCNCKWPVITGNYNKVKSKGELKTKTISLRSNLGKAIVFMLWVNPRLNHAMFLEKDVHKHDFNDLCLTMQSVHIREHSHEYLERLTHSIASLAQ